MKTLRTPQELADVGLIAPDRVAALAGVAARYAVAIPPALAALAAMPPACGIALGFDRLVMLATGAPRIEQVLWTPVAEPQ